MEATESSTPVWLTSMVGNEETAAALFALYQLAKVIGLLLLFYTASAAHVGYLAVQVNEHDQIDKHFHKPFRTWMLTALAITPIFAYAVLLFSLPPHVYLTKHGRIHVSKPGSKWMLVGRGVLLAVSAAAALVFVFFALWALGKHLLSL